MTSTPFNVGLNDSARLSSRVLRPPGGGHTDIFGGEPEPAPRGRRGAPQPAAVAQQEEPKPTNGTTPNGQEAQPEQKSPEPKSEPTPAPIPSPAKAAPEPPRAEPPKRVRVPPGGFSSGLCPIQDIDKKSHLRYHCLRNIVLKDSASRDIKNGQAE
ncbi:hypothetical protein K1T71_012380 [Dendrolimus kikuchii]|uniref:Uncharacterized protein n=1 Tax=Dendrolimus kikuchii TaxID=765133 RepID=A0ACC1CLQ7_9NEOP|nr:hypothetical protein K1T71_012380 [Dendrolimus kikuchii]